MICAQDFISYIVLGMHSMWMIHLNVLIWGFIILETCCLAFQVDIPTLIIENVGKEGLKHLEMYLSAKEKGIYIYISVWLSKIVYLILDNHYHLGVSWHCVWWWEKMYLTKLLTFQGLLWKWCVYYCFSSQSVTGNQHSDGNFRSLWT